MKPSNKNNPIAVGALLGVLFVTLFLIFKQLNRENPTVAVLTPASDKTVIAEPQSPAPAGSSGSSRDPFDHPMLHRAENKGNSSPKMTSEAAQITLPGSNIPGFPLRIAPTSLRPLAPKPALSQVKSPVAPGSGGMPVAYPASSGAALPVPEAEDPLKGWRVTAIIAGHPLRAVIERAGAEPCQVSVGDWIHEMQITAINEREIVLRDAVHLFTLPFLTTPALPEGGSDNREDDNGKVSGSQPTLTSTRENNNGTANHP